MNFLIALPNVKAKFPVVFYLVLATRTPPVPGLDNLLPRRRDRKHEEARAHGTHSLLAEKSTPNSGIGA
jgi:hypothetical protein